MIRHHLVGAAHLDRIGRTASAAVLKQSNPGHFTEAPGGAALNVASNMKAFGADVMLSTILGQDSAAVRIADAMTARDVELAAQQSTDGAATASYTAVIDTAGDLVIALADMGIYGEMQANAVKFEPEDWVTCDANLSSSTIEAVMNFTAAFKAGLTVSAAKAGRLQPVLGRLDVLFTNRAEAAALCDLPTEAPMVDLVNRLIGIGARRAVISDGASPVCVLENGQTVFVTPRPTEITDVTGAGDALASGCLFALGNGASLLDAVATGIQAARAILNVSGPYRADLAKAFGDPR